MFESSSTGDRAASDVMKSPLLLPVQRSFNSTDSGPRVIDRRAALGLLGAAGAALLTACTSTGNTPTESTESTEGESPASASTSTSGEPTASTSTATSTATTSGNADTVDVAVTPPETAGPFPANGTNDNGDGSLADLLGDVRAIRADIRSDLDGGNMQPGVPMSLTVTVIDSATDHPAPGTAVYVWHCNQAGVYSQYNSPMLGGDFSDVSWLRGVQIADADGVVTFQTILPGRYQGRAAHIHFEVFADTTFEQTLLTSQMAFDDVVVDALYASSGYTDALTNDTNNTQDGIFADGWDEQLLTITGDGAEIAASITVGV